MVFKTDGKRINEVIPDENNYQCIYPHPSLAGPAHPALTLFGKNTTLLLHIGNI